MSGSLDVVRLIERLRNTAGVCEREEVKNLPMMRELASALSELTTQAADALAALQAREAATENLKAERRDTPQAFRVRPAEELDRIKTEAWQWAQQLDKRQPLTTGEIGSIASCLRALYWYGAEVYGDVVVQRAEAAEAREATLRLERDSAREQFDKHVEWASGQVKALRQAQAPLVKALEELKAHAEYTLDRSGQRTRPALFVPSVAKRVLEIVTPALASVDPIPVSTET